MIAAITIAADAVQRARNISSHDSLSGLRIVLSDAGFSAAKAAFGLLTPTPTPGPTNTPTPTPAPTLGDRAFIPPAGTVFWPSGVFNVPVSNPVIDPNSASMLARALTCGKNCMGRLQVSTHPLRHRDGSVWPTDGQTTVYIARNSDPAYAIQCMKYGGACTLSGQSVNIPIGAIPGGNLGFTSYTDPGSKDQHMAVRNIDTQIETDFWLAPLPNGIGGIYQVGWGGAFPFSSGGYGHGGATAAGFALTQGRVRPADLLAGGVLPYALVLSTPCENGHVFPASGDDGSSSYGYGCPPIGAHVWLDSSDADVEASGMSAIWKPAFKALHKWGGYIEDRASAPMGFAFEGGTSELAYSQPNPWASIIPAYFPNAVPKNSGSNQYTIPVLAGNIDLTRHLHIIQTQSLQSVNIFGLRRLFVVPSRQRPPLAPSPHSYRL